MTTPTIIPLAEMERRHILAACAACGHNAIAAARALGIGKTTLYRKLHDYGVLRKDGKRFIWRLHMEPVRIGDFFYAAVNDGDGVWMVKRWSAEPKPNPDDYMEALITIDDQGTDPRTAIDAAITRGSWA